MNQADLKITPKEVTELFSKIEQKLIELQKEDQSLNIKIVCHEDSRIEEIYLSGHEVMIFASTLEIEVKTTESGNTINHKIEFIDYSNNFYVDWENEKYSSCISNDQDGRDFILNGIQLFVKCNKRLQGK